MSLSSADKEAVRRIAEQVWGQQNDGRAGSTDATDRRASPNRSIDEEQHQDNSVPSRALKEVPATKVGTLIGANFPQLDGPPGGGKEGRLPAGVVIRDSDFLGELGAGKVPTHADIRGEVPPAKAPEIDKLRGTLDYFALRNKPDLSRFVTDEGARAFVKPSQVRKIARQVVKDMVKSGSLR